MNPRQITILWLVLTALLPTTYFVLSRGIQIERQLSENRVIRQNTSITNKDSYIITAEVDGKILTYEVTTDHYPTEEECEKLIAGGRLLSDREVTAWLEKDAIEQQRRKYWEFSASGLFVVASITGLLLFRATQNHPQAATK